MSLIRQGGTGNAKEHYLVNASPFTVSLALDSTDTVYSTASKAMYGTTSTLASALGQTLITVESGCSNARAIMLKPLPVGVSYASFGGQGNFTLDCVSPYYSNVYRVGPNGRSSIVFSSGVNYSFGSAVYVAACYSGVSTYPIPASLGQVVVNMYLPNMPDVSHGQQGLFIDMYLASGDTSTYIGKVCQDNRNGPGWKIGATVTSNVANDFLPLPATYNFQTVGNSTTHSMYASARYPAVAASSGVYNRYFLGAISGNSALVKSVQDAISAAAPNTSFIFSCYPFATPMSGYQMIPMVVDSEYTEEGSALIGWRGCVRTHMDCVLASGHSFDYTNPTDHYFLPMVPRAAAVSAKNMVYPTTSATSKKLVRIKLGTSVNSFQYPTNATTGVSTAITIASAIHKSYYMPAKAASTWEEVQYTPTPFTWDEVRPGWFFNRSAANMFPPGAISGVNYTYTNEDVAYSYPSAITYYNSAVSYWMSPVVFSRRWRWSTTDYWFHGAGTFTGTTYQPAFTQPTMLKLVAKRYNSAATVIYNSSSATSYLFIDYLNDYDYSVSGNYLPGLIVNSYFDTDVKNTTYLSIRTSDWQSVATTSNVLRDGKYKDLPSSNVGFIYFSPYSRYSTGDCVGRVTGDLTSGMASTYNRRKDWTGVEYMRSVDANGAFAFSLYCYHRKFEYTDFFRTYRTSGISSAFDMITLTPPVAGNVTIGTDAVMKADSYRKQYQLNCMHSKATKNATYSKSIMGTTKWLTWNPIANSSLPASTVVSFGQGCSASAQLTLSTGDLHIFGAYSSADPYMTKFITSNTYTIYSNTPYNMTSFGGDDVIMTFDGDANGQGGGGPTWALSTYYSYYKNLTSASNAYNSFISSLGE